jgi:hypothetical protein
MVCTDVGGDVAVADVRVPEAFDVTVAVVEVAMTAEMVLTMRVVLTVKMSWAVKLSTTSPGARWPQQRRAEQHPDRSKDDSSSHGRPPPRTSLYRCRRTVARTIYVGEGIVYSPRWLPYPSWISGGTSGLIKDAPPSA